MVAAVAKAVCVLSFVLLILLISSRNARRLFLLILVFGIIYFLWQGMTSPNGF